jgi:hypothetical protein
VNGGEQRSSQPQYVIIISKLVSSMLGLDCVFPACDLREEGGIFLVLR